MIQPEYPAERAMASTVQEHFARRVAAARRQTLVASAWQPDTEVIKAIIDAAFRASLRRNDDGFARHKDRRFARPRKI